MLLHRLISTGFFVIFLGVMSHPADAQQRCGTVEHSLSQSSATTLKQTEQIFERWLLQKRELKYLSRSQAATYQIPVVVHIVHNGEAEGISTNISDAQVLSQIKVLNEDFRRENADASNTPAMFLPFAGSMDVEFVLAKRDPEGKSTNGIVRIQGAKTSWTTNDNYELKSQSYWPAEDYLNLWVCNLTDFIGYAQFPVSDLPGLEGSSNNRLTDGVVLWYRAVGSDNDGNFSLDPDYNKGRTATHEISHFFGLRHTWGDEDACSGTDYVDDTPNQANYTTGCPTAELTSCGTSNMYQNFLDYTDDACMNLFTQGQIDRMQTVMENSPRRISLLTSPGLSPPDAQANDLGLREIVSPELTQCSRQLDPVVEIKNYGSNKVTSVRIRVKLNGTTVETKDAALNLLPQDSADISFNPIDANTGTNTIAFEILLTNGQADGDAVGNDNILTRQVLVPPSIALPFSENFNELPADWTIVNPDQQITWELAGAPHHEADNKAIALRFFDYEDNFGEQDILYSPVFDLSLAEQATLLFDLAHARFDFSSDRLKVLAITGCSDISKGVVIYDSAGLKLSTSPSTRSFFKPNSTNDWERELVSLDAFSGEQFVQLAFVGINDYGNNLYLDNITVTTSGLHDIQLSRISSPSLVTCKANNGPVIHVQNTGTEEIQSVMISYSLNGDAGTTTLTGLALQPGAETDLALPALTFEEGENILVIEAEEVNGIPDDYPLNNKQETIIVVNQSTDRIPLRQAFENLPDDAWTIINPTGGMEWKSIATNYGTSLYFNAFNNPVIGDEAWLVSPSLDFRRASEASMLFDVSYRQVENRPEDLRILVSTNCGGTYEPLDYQLPDQEFSAGSWAPSNEDDWFTNEIDLSGYAGKNDIRLAFVVTNGNGNNLYLDNIEFFVTNDPREVPIDTHYAVFGYDLNELSNSKLKVGFNLTRRQDVHCQIVDRMGKVVSEITWTDVLNQVFDLPLKEDVASGIYIVRLGINQAFFGTRIFVTR